MDSLSSRTNLPPFPRQSGRAFGGFVLAILLTCSAAASDSDLHSHLAAVLDEEGLTGIAWTLIGHDGEASVDAIGFRDAPAKIPFTADTRFHVGSLTKSVLATGVLVLATEGSIDLDAPVTDYLPGIAFGNPWEDAAAVSVRHLLDHTSGLDDARLWQMFSERPMPDTPLGDAIAGLEPLQIRSRPGSRFSYSNLGYTLLGMVIESVTGTRYEIALADLVLVPLGMADSTFEFTTQEGASADPSLAWGHIDDGSRYPARAVFLRPAAQFTTTAADLARFAGFVLGDGAVDGERLVEQGLMEARGRPGGTEAAEGGLIAGYALGLGRRDRHGVVGLCHGGNIVGFMAMLCVFPEDGKAFAYSVNTDSETADYGRVNELLIAALDLTTASPPETVAPPADRSEWLGYYALSPNRFEAFRYLDTVFNAVHVSEDDDSLILSYTQRGPRELRPVGGSIYSAEDRTTASHIFMRSSDGSYLLSDGFQTYEQVPAGYFFAHWASVILGLAGLGWLLLAGSVRFMRNTGTFSTRTETPALLAILVLALPAPFFLAQSFMALGDLTIASLLLAAVTLSLPIGITWTLIRASLRRDGSRFEWSVAIAAVLALQWCVVLAANGMLPLRLWV